MPCDVSPVAMFLSKSVIWPHFHLCRLAPNKVVLPMDVKKYELRTDKQPQTAFWMSHLIFLYNVLLHLVHLVHFYYLAP